MTLVYRLQGIDFEWDADKAESNIAKHGIRFEEAAEAFFDPFYQTGDASTDDEPRDFLLGYSSFQHLLLFIQIQRGDRTRIISAPATARAERKSYEEPEKAAEEREELSALRLRPRPTETVTVRLLTDTLAALREAAAGRDMALESLLKFYIGQGLRQDLARQPTEQTGQ